MHYTMMASNRIRIIRQSLLLFLGLCFDPSLSLAPVQFDSPHSKRTAIKSANSDNIPHVYPSSTRQALIEKAKVLDQSKGSYSTVGWSNRLGTVLTPASIPGVYTADRPFYWNKIDVGCRMTVVKLTGNENINNCDLWVHSPVALDGPLQKALAQLGTVKHVVSPNYEHVRFAKQWADAYPDACIWGCPGLPDREPLTRWTGQIPYGCRPPQWSSEDVSASPFPSPPEEMWDWNEIQPLHVDCEKNPFTGDAFFNECVFYHTASKTLMATDLYWNYPKGDGVTNSNYEGLPGSKEEDFGDWELAPSVEKIPFGSKFWKFGMDKIYLPFYMNLMVMGDSTNQFRDLASFIYGKNGGWDVETVIPSHGDILRGKTFIKSVLKNHFQQ